ncbi:MAG: glutamine hydrolyzing CTP synthase [Phycisphaerae bacterium]
MTKKENILASVGNISSDTEFFSPIPEGYVKGKTKFVVILGTVMSGLGKGIFSSCVAKLLQDKGLKVAPIKLEGYLNMDSGTLNPFRHGEVFVLDDGMECDMDLGTYERMLNIDLCGQNFSTNGQIFSSVLKNERGGGYLGRDVQVIPHVTGEVKRRLRCLARDSEADVVFVEIGGTAGDLENAFYIEAMRELANEEGESNCCFVALTYILAPQTLGEQKSKAAQLGIRELLQKGIQPSIIACRCEQEVTNQVLEKISLFSNVPYDNVFSMHDADSIYMIPSMLRKSGVDFSIIKMLGVENKIDLLKERDEWAKWCEFTDRVTREKKNEVTIGITGKYISVRDSYASISNAIEHCEAWIGCRVNVKWIEVTDITEENVESSLRNVDAIIVPGGFGVRGTEGKIECIRYARENKLPYLGLCMGFQMAVIEFARNVCGLEGANSSEIEPDCKHPVIGLLPEQKKIEGLGGNMRLGGRTVAIKEDSLASKLFSDKLSARLRFRHRYEVDPKYIETLEENGLVFSGHAPDYNIMQILEIPDHPFFLGTQSHPCLTSRPLDPSPMFLGLVAAAMKHKFPGIYSEDLVSLVKKARPKK